MAKSKDGNATALPDTAVPVAIALPVAIVAYKGFDKNLQCLGFQYEFGKTYDNGGKPVVRCGPGAFHSCEHPLDVLNYYPPVNGARFATVTPDGQIAREPNSDTKIASAKITINAEASLGDLGRSAVKWVAEMAKQAGQYMSGPEAHSSTAGVRAHSEVRGTSSIAAALGADGTATAVDGSAIMLAAYDTDVWPYKLIGVRAAMVGENGVEAGKKYRLTRDMQFEEVVG